MRKENIINHDTRCYFSLLEVKTPTRVHSGRSAHRTRTRTQLSFLFVDRGDPPPRVHDVERDADDELENESGASRVSTLQRRHHASRPGTHHQGPVETVKQALILDYGSAPSFEQLDGSVDRSSNRPAHQPHMAQARRTPRLTLTE
jgi:hypothetical protein